MENSKVFIERFSAAPRSPGSPLLDEICTELEFVMSANEYNVEKYFASVPNWKSISEPSIHLFVEGSWQVYPVIPAIYSLGTPTAGLAGRVETSGKFTILDSFEWDSFDIKNSDGELIGKLIYSPYASMPQPVPNNHYEIPVVIITTDIYETISRCIECSNLLNIKMYLHVEQKGNVQIQSLVCHPKEITAPLPLICAHIDSMHGSHGAHDNLSGVTVALEIAKVIRSRGISCSFGFFNGEESNKAGSSSYVSTLDDTQLSRMYSYVIEVDSVGIGDQIALLCSKNIYKKIKTVKFESTKEWPGNIDISCQSKISFSDVWPFMLRKIPAVRMLSRDRISKMDQYLMHSKHDTAEHINYDTLNAAFHTLLDVLLQLKGE